MKINKNCEADLYKNIETASAALAEGFDIMSLPTGFYENPYPIYHALRRYAPVHKMSSGAWFLTRHNDLTEIYKDPTLFSSDKTVDFRKTMGTTARYEHHTTSLVFNDPPRHSRVRKRVAPAFTPRALRTLTKRVETGEVLSQLIGQDMDGAELGELELLHNCIFYSMRDMKPDEVDIGRSPNRHFAFGTGIHACAGMSLSRMELQTAINKLIQRFGSIEQKGPNIRQQRARFLGFDKYLVSVSG